MAEVVSLEELWEWVAQRRDVLGMTDHEVWLMRHSDERLTEGKRELLRRIAERCREAGIEPVVKF
jgi:hypothetical protein